MELNETLIETLDSLKGTYELLDAKIPQSSKTYEKIVEEIHEIADNLVTSIRKHEDILITKAREISQLNLLEMAETKEDIAMQIEEIENVLCYNEKLASLTDEDDDKLEWEKAINTKMIILCEIDKDLKTSDNNFIEFRRLLLDCNLIDAFCNYGDVICTSYEITDTNIKDPDCCDLISFDENANIVKPISQTLEEDGDSSYEAIPYL